MRPDDAELATLAHGMLSTVAAIKGAAEVLERQGVGAEGSVDARCLAIIIEQSESMVRTLRQLASDLSPGD